LQPLLNGIGKLVLGLKRDDLGVALLYDQRNLDRIGNGLHSMTMAYTILRHLGLQTEFVHGDQIAAGELPKRQLKVLWLPYQINMDPPVAEAIRRFVAAGGAVIADVQPGVTNGFRRYDQPLLQDLFVEPATLNGPQISLGNFYPGERGRTQKDAEERGLGTGKIVGAGLKPAPTAVSGQRKSALIRVHRRSPANQSGAKSPISPTGRMKGGMPPASAEDLRDWNTHEKSVGQGRTLLFGECPSTYRKDQWQPRGQFLRQAVADFLAQCGVHAAAAVQVAAGAFEPLDLVTYHDGDALYAVVQRHYAVSDPAPRDFDIINLSGKAHVYDVRQGKYLGESDRARLTMEAARGGMVVFLPYRAKALEVEGLPQTGQLGVSLHLRLRLLTEGGPPGHGVFRLETLNPAGETVPPLCRKVRWTGGAAEVTLPLAHNDPVGTWTVRVTDVATGVMAERTLTVAAAGP
jgi:hypothetical protein